jgi:hypothetical protein
MNSSPDDRRILTLVNTTGHKISVGHADIVRPIREIVRRREETTGHSVRPK